MRIRSKICILLGVLVLASCANRGVGPQGGPRDTIPPMPVKSEPENGSVNFTGNRIEITFNEYLQLDNLGNNLLMSPPQQRPPEVKARGKRLIIQFADTLRDSTTYTLDFGDAVCDYTEKNPLHGYSYGFSTGPTIDTLETYGRVYMAENLNPVSGVIVGIHDNMDDSAFTTMPFLRIARSDSAGYFRIGNMRDGIYRLYAVEEKSKDYRFTIGEAIAWADETVGPGDTTELFLFKEQRQRLYLQRTLRTERHQVQMYFSAPPDSAPRIRPLLDSMELNYHVFPSAKGDTISLWLLDSASIKQDSLFFEITYRRTDSVYNLEWFTDTVRAIWRAPRLSAKAQEALARKNRNRRLVLKSNASKSFDVFDTIRLTSTTPLAQIKREAIHLVEKIDTTYRDVEFTLAPYDTLPMTLLMPAVLEPGKKYELQLDSGALTDVYGISHIHANYGLTMKTLEDYSTIRVKMTTYHPQARIQVLNSRDKVVREQAAETEGTLFKYLKPDTYYIRMYLDLNGDGAWTTGDWSTKRQPEPVYYFPERIQTKSNWDFEEEWDYTASPQTATKPQELMKPKK